MKFYAIRNLKCYCTLILFKCFKRISFYTTLVKTGRIWQSSYFINCTINFINFTKRCWVMYSVSCTKTNFLLNSLIWDNLNGFHPKIFIKNRKIRQFLTFSTNNKRNWSPNYSIILEDIIVEDEFNKKTWIVFNIFICKYTKIWINSLLFDTFNIRKFSSNLFFNSCDPV